MNDSKLDFQMSNELFTYGTLAMNEELPDATLKGFQVIPVINIEGSGYSGLMKSNSKSIVKGKLIKMTSVNDLIKYDRYEREGDLYIRKLIKLFEPSRYVWAYLISQEYLKQSLKALNSITFPVNLQVHGCHPNILKVLYDYYINLDRNKIT